MKDTYTYVKGHIANLSFFPQIDAHPIEQCIYIYMWNILIHISTFRIFEYVHIYIYEYAYMYIYIYVLWHFVFLEIGTQPMGCVYKYMEYIYTYTYACTYIYTQITKQKKEMKIPIEAIGESDEWCCSNCSSCVFFGKP